MQDVFLQKIVLYKTGLYERSYIKQGYIKQGYIRPGRMKRRDINAARLDWLSHRGSGPSAQAADCRLYKRPGFGVRRHSGRRPWGGSGLQRRLRQVLPENRFRVVGGQLRRKVYLF